MHTTEETDFLPEATQRQTTDTQVENHCPHSWDTEAWLREPNTHVGTPACSRCSTRAAFEGIDVPAACICEEQAPVMTYFDPSDHLPQCPLGQGANRCPAPPPDLQVAADILACRQAGDWITEHLITDRRGKPRVQLALLHASQSLSALPEPSCVPEPSSEADNFQYLAEAFELDLDTATASDQQDLIDAFSHGINLVVQSFPQHFK